MNIFGLFKEVLDFVAADGFSYLWELKLMFDLPYSLQQINLILKKHGLNTHTARQKTLITEEAKTKRKIFAEQHLAANTDWTQVMFSDEKTVQNFSNGIVKVRRFRGTAWQEKNIIRKNSRDRRKVNFGLQCKLYMFTSFYICVLHCYLMFLIVILTVYSHFFVKNVFGLTFVMLYMYSFLFSKCINFLFSGESVGFHFSRNLWATQISGWHEWRKFRVH